MHSSNAVALSFPVLRTNDYGRFVIKRHMRNHNALVKTALVHVDDRLGDYANKNRAIMKHAERFKESVHIMEKRQRDDKVLSELIHHARPSCDTSVSEHVNRYRLLREARPTWQPGWLQRTELQLSKSTHERVIRNAHSQIDMQAPEAAIHFRKVLNDSRYTRGGVMRRSEPMPRRRRQGRATSSMSEPETTHAGPMDSATVPRTRKKSGRTAGYKQLRPHQVDSLHLAPDNLPDIVKDDKGQPRRRGRRGSVSHHDHCAPPAELRAQHLLKSGQAKADSLSIRKRRKSICEREMVVVKTKPSKSLDPSESVSPPRRRGAGIAETLPHVDPSDVQMQARAADEPLDFTHKEWTRVRDWCWKTGEEYHGIPGDCRGELLSVAHGMNEAQQHFEGTAEEVCKYGSEKLLPAALQFLHKQPVRVPAPMAAQIAALKDKGFKPALIMHLQKLRQYGSALNRPELPRLKDTDMRPIVNHLFAISNAVRRAGQQLNTSTEDTELSDWNDAEEEQDDFDVQVKQLDDTVLKAQNNKRVDEEVAKLDASVVAEKPGAHEEEPVGSEPVAQDFDPETPRAPGPVESAAEPEPEPEPEPPAESEPAAEPEPEPVAAAEEAEEEEEYGDDEFFEEGDGSVAALTAATGEDSAAAAEQ